MKITRLVALVAAVLVGGQQVSHADVKWDLGGDLSESFDDNIAYTKDDKMSDWITRLSLQGGFMYEGKNERMDAHATVTQSVYADNSSFNNLAESLDINASKDFSPYDRVTFHDDFNHSQDPVTLESAFGRTTGHYSMYNNNFNVGYEREISRQWSIRGKYFQSNYMFNRDDLSDAAEYSPGIFSEYSIDSATKTLLGYNFGRWAFEDGASANIHTLTAGLRRFLTPQLYLDVKPGLTLIRDFNGERMVKPRYELALTDDLNETTSFTLGFIKEYSATPFMQDIFNNWRALAEVTRELTSRIRGSLSLFYGQGKYISSDIEDKFSGASVGVGYILTRNSNLYLTYTLEKTDSNVDARSYTRNMVMLGIKISF